MFGRRHKQSAYETQLTLPGPDRDGIKRAIPLELWEGELGDKMRKLGLSPNDARNIIPEQANAVRQTNANPPDGVTVTPLSMLT